MLKPSTDIIYDINENMTAKEMALLIKSQYNHLVRIPGFKFIINKIKFFLLL
jgi:hypothetical protein